MRAVEPLKLGSWGNMEKEGKVALHLSHEGPTCSLKGQEELLSVAGSIAVGHSWSRLGDVSLPPANCVGNSAPLAASSICASVWQISPSGNLPI